MIQQAINNTLSNVNKIQSGISSNRPSTIKPMQTHSEEKAKVATDNVKQIQTAVKSQKDRLLEKRHHKRQLLTKKRGV